MKKLTTEDLLSLGFEYSIFKFKDCLNDMVFKQDKDILITFWESQNNEQCATIYGHNGEPIYKGVARNKQELKQALQLTLYPFINYEEK